MMKRFLTSSWLIIIPFTIIFSLLIIVPLITTLDNLEPGGGKGKIEQIPIKKPKVTPEKKEIVNDPSEEIEKEEILLLVGLLTLFTMLISLLFTPSEIRSFFKRAYFFSTYPLKKQRFKGKLSNDYSKIHLPFRPEKPLSMDDVFMTLSVINPQGEYFSYEDRFEQNETIDTILTKVNRCVILGVPGSGKSLLCKNLIYRYSESKLPIELNNFIPVLIEISNLTNEKDIIKEINSFFEFGSLSTDFLLHFIEKGKLLIMFDGFDEIRKEDKKQVVSAIQGFIRKYDKCKYLITCRVSVYNEEFSDLIEKKYLLKDFNEKQIKQYLIAWGKNNNARVEDLISALHDRANIRNLAGNPLQLAIIAYLVVDKDAKLPHSRGEFYNMVAKNLLGNSQKSVSPDTDYENGIEALKQIALFMHSSKSSNIKEIEKYKVLEKIEEALNYSRKEAEDIFNKVIKPSNIIYEINKKTLSYKFFHDSFREYLVALHYIEQPDKLLNEFKNNKNNWHEVVKFWCCLTNDRDISEFILKTYEIEPFLSLDYIAEASIVDTNKFSLIIENFLNFETLPESKIESVIKSLGTIIANKNNPQVEHKLGEVVFSDLRNKVYDSSDKFLLKTAASILSFSAIEDSAKVLVDNFDKDIVIFEALINLGYLAVPLLIKIARSGEPKAVECIFKIDTDEALLGLIDLLRIKNNIEISSKAAWLLSSEDSINRIRKLASKIPKQKKESYFEELDFVWEPFDDGTKSTPYKTINRIADLINKSSPPKLLPIDFVLDERIAIPLAMDNNLVENVIKNTNYKTNLQKILLYTNKTIHNSLIKIAAEKPTPTKEMWINMNKKHGKKEYYEYKFSLEYFISISFIFLLIPGIILSFYSIEENAIYLDYLLFIIFIISTLHFCFIFMFQIDIRFPIKFIHMSSELKFKIEKYGFSTLSGILTYIYMLIYIVQVSHSENFNRSEIQGFLLMSIVIIAVSDLVLWGKNREYQSFNPLRKLLNIKLKHQKEIK